jgi:hypothetical protein
MNIVHDVGTPHNHHGRGICERAIGSLRAILERSLPHGRPQEWGNMLSVIQHAYNASPHAGVGGFSPFELSHPRQAASVTPALFKGDDLRSEATATSAGAEYEALAARQGISSLCTETRSFARAADSMRTLLPRYEVGQLVWAYFPSAALARRQSQDILAAVVAREEDERSGQPTGFYHLAEVQPAHTASTPALASVTFSRHASALRPAHLDHRSVRDVLRDRLPEGYAFIAAIESENAAGEYLVRYENGFKGWLGSAALRGNEVLAAYQRQKGARAKSASTEGP